MSGRPDPAFWRGKRVFLTGHTGFKGAWLALWLHELGAEVTGYALPPEPGRPSLFEVADVRKGMRSQFADIRDRAALATALADSSADVVFHLAAQSLVRRSYSEPVETYATNVMGTVHLLEAARSAASVRAVVVVTSDKCYENREWPHTYRESDAMGGHDPYSSSKGCAELVTAAYRASFFQSGAGIATARAGNVIGGGDWAPDRLVPDLVSGFARGAAVAIRSPGATRPWQHVLEPLRGYLMLAERLASAPASAAEAWNFGPFDRSTVSVRALAESVVRHWGSGTVDYAQQEPGLHEAGLLAVDWGKARARLGWMPRFDLDESVRLTVEWYRSYYADPSSAGEVTRRQLRDYLAR